MVGRRQLVLASCALLAASAAVTQAGSTAPGRDVQILRVSFSPAAGLDFVDPALSFTQPGWSLLDATCARIEAAGGGLLSDTRIGRPGARVRVIMAHDPDGLRLELIEGPGDPNAVPGSAGYLVGG